MTRLHQLRSFLLAWALLYSAGGEASADDTKLLRVFGGGPPQRPELLRRILDEYEARNPEIRVEIGLGGATSELQRRYLTTLLNGSDATFDALLLDVVATPQFAAAGWLEPLDAHLSEPAAQYFSDFFPVYGQINRRDGEWFAVPYDTSALFLYYRKDLLEKYGRPVPQTWAELADTALVILSGEAKPALKGLSFQGAPIEGTVATFLLPYWSSGAEFLDSQGRLSLERDAALASFRLWISLIEGGIAPANSAEIKTGDTINEFAAGQAVFALNWGSAWEHFAQNTGSRVSGAFGIALPPATSGGTQVTALGGYQWVLSRFSRHKKEAALLIQFLTSRETSAALARAGYSMPSRLSVYRDKDVLQARPWLADAEVILRGARPRPVTPRYAEVSETLRRTTSAVLGGAQDAGPGVDEIQRRLSRVLK